MADSVYANVIVDIQASELKDKLFTYRVPVELSAETFIGAQVLVPFGGRDLVGGFVVSLTDTVQSEMTIKDIAEVIEPEPLFDKDYVELLYWIADFYCANLSDVISAAVPSMLTPKFKRIVRLNQNNFERRHGGQSLNSYEPASAGILGTLSESKTAALSMVALKQRWLRATRLHISKFYRALALLRQEGLISVAEESTGTQAPKVVATVIWTGKEGASARQKEVLSVLTRHGGQMPMTELVEQAKTSSTTLKRFSEQGFVSITLVESVRDPMSKIEGADSNEDLNLTSAQSTCLGTLANALNQSITVDCLSPVGNDSGSPWLLHGVTGSGKTEIYLRLIKQALAAGRSAMLLVPEISLTPQLARRLKSRFGDQVSVWHSALSAGEKYDTWRRMRQGEARVLLGARSAILVNLPKLALIILDEEHDGSYKQVSPSPRYHAKDVAIERGKRTGALVLLGSATPDVGTYLSAQERGKILELPERVFKQAMPEVRMVDMREEFGRGNKSIFSLTLAEQLDLCLSRGEQAILLINRRGYASHVFCRACGFVVKCKNCSVALVFHQRAGLNRKDGEPTYASGFLACHHCGFSLSALSVCPSCKGPFIRQYGLGTQRVEEEVRHRHESARVLRLDSDVTTRKGAHDQILTSFAQGEAQVLIGTQMVSKGLDIANVTLVGVMTADAAFNLPDYRSTERGFQLLTQVSGRAGRGDRPGKVILQTYDCEMPALEWAKTHDYRSFLLEELAARKAFEYPPFSQIIRVVVQGPDPESVEGACHRLAEELSHSIEDLLPLQAVKVLGPAPCLIERLRGKFRYHLLIKNLAGEAGRSLLTQFLRNKQMGTGLNMAVDVDALDLI